MRQQLTTNRGQFAEINGEILRNWNERNSGRDIIEDARAEYEWLRAEPFNRADCLEFCR